MASTLSHRGPDDEGFYLRDGVGLGHRRLSIIDLDAGKQPICNEDETVWIVYNGEIYNYQALRKELLKKGHVFRTRTDTEVIIHLYEEFGETCVEKLNGMFAFAIWDCSAQKLFLARDRIGQKPLFYAFIGGQKFLFASEVKSILAASGIERKMDFEALHHYLSLRFIPSPRTMFEDIKKLPAGHFLVYEKGTIRINRYWDLFFTEKLALSDDEFVEGLRDKLSDCCRSHLVSDVPVGAFLSGGMDTSTIVAFMGNHLPSSFKTFAIGVAEQDYNELPYARMVAGKYHTEHIEEVVKADLVKLLPLMTWHLDEPSDPIAACMFHAARLASQHVKVVMGGDGGDELFAGFDRYIGVNYINYYAYLPILLRQALIGPVIKTIPDSFTYKSFTQRARWMHQLSFFSEGERYAEATAFFRFSHQDKKNLLGDSLWKILRENRSSEIIVEQYLKPNATTSLDKMLYADFMTRLTEHTLMLTDRMNMAHGLEARSPFLDHTLVEYMARFPENQKIRGRELKYVLRRVADRYLPPEILKRKKQGFMFPIAYWFRNELYAFLKNVLLESRLVKENFIQKNTVARLIEEHRNYKADHHVRLWMLLSLEVWFQIYIEQRETDSVENHMNEKM
ncbi:MAG: asparagine synthase (glutamine-hydrolyzing) [Deltaproteobacteria bacterium]